MSAARIMSGASAVVAGLGLLSGSTGIVSAQAGRPGPAAAAGIISTVAGGVGGPARATAVNLGAACDVAYSAGSLYVGSGSTVRVINAKTDRLTTAAGTGVPFQISPPQGDGGPAQNATLKGTCGVALGPAGSLVIADAGHNQIRLVAGRTGRRYGRAMTAGDIYPVAGDGAAGYGGDGGPARSAVLNRPTGVTVDSAGNLLIADTWNNRIRVVAGRTGRFYGRKMTSGDIYTVAGDGVSGVGGIGGPATSAELVQPNAVTVDGAGNLLIADTVANYVLVVAERTGRSYGQKMTAGDIYTVAGNGFFQFSGDGGPARSAAIDQPGEAIADRAGNLVIADTWNNRIRIVAARTGRFYGRKMTAGDIYTIAGGDFSEFGGDGGPARSAELNHPSGVTLDGSGNLVIADNGNLRLRVIAAATGRFYGRPMTAGHIYTVAGTGSLLFTGAGGLATAAEFMARGATPGIGGVAVDQAGNLVMTAASANRVLVVPGRTGTFYGQPMTAGHIYTIAGTGRLGFGGDGRSALDATLAGPWGVAVDGAGNVLIAAELNDRIRVVAERTGRFYGQKMTAGDIYTVAGGGAGCVFSGDRGPATSASLCFPTGVAVDGFGNLLIADSENGAIRVVPDHSGTYYGRAMAGGHIYTIAGTGHDGYSGDNGPATSAELSLPQTARVDSSGNVVIADTSTQRVRVVAEKTGTFYGHPMKAGDIYTVAGTGNCGYNGDGLLGPLANLCHPGSVTVDAAGNLVITDSGGNRIRVVAASKGTFYGQAMAPGDIYSVAGDGVAGCGGDGGPATKAQIGYPQDVTVNHAGDLLIAQWGCRRIRMVSGPSRSRG